MSVGNGTDSRLDVESLACPDSFYWPGYCWFWQDRITREALSSQLQDMYSHGAKSVWPFAWPNFRPKTNPTSMEPEYLSPEFLRLYRHMVEEAERLGMQVWLYDEGGWPSGGVCGRVVRENPELAEQFIERTELIPAAGETVGVPPDCLAAFLYRDSFPAKRLSPGSSESADGDNNRIVLFHARRRSDESEFGVPYPDLLNPRSTQEFIRLTHEVYKKTVGEHFGKTIPLVFADESRANERPWTDDLAADFEKTKGYDIREHLSAIFDPDGPEGMQARVDYYDWWSNRFVKAFFGQIQEWCRENNLLSAGHIGGEDDTLGARIHGFGHHLRVFRMLDIPGVDTIWRQIFPGGEHTIKHYWGSEITDITAGKNHHAPKYASSVAHQQNKPWVLTESFAIYGSGLTPEQMKWITDFQYVRGINLMTGGAYPLSTREHYMAGARPMAGKGNPLWDHLNLYHEYTARLSYLLSLGKPAIDTAVYFPIRDVWAGGPDVRGIAESNDTLAKLLLENQCDYDFIDDDLLESESTTVTDGTFNIGPMKYRTVCVSRTMWMSERSVRKLSEFASAGGRVLWVDAYPDAPRPEGSICIGFDRLLQYIDPLAHVEPSNAYVRVCKRTLENGNLYFITNEDVKGVNATITFKECLPAVQVDPETGNCWSPTGALYSKDSCSIQMNLEMAGSQVILFTEESLPLKSAPPRGDVTLAAVDSGWSVRKMKSYLIGEHDFEVSECTDETPLPVELGDWRSTLGEDFSGDAEYRVEFECSEETALKAILLDLGNVRYACEAALNGANLGKRLWKPFTFPITGVLREGRNELRVVVTNTMANQYVTTKVLDKWPDNVIGPYHKTALGFELDSVPSGLYGPVTIRA